MIRTLFALSLLLVAPHAAAAQTAPDLPPDQAFLYERVAHLASDELRGREAGTEDYDRATQYVVAQMQAIGLEPGGVDGSWFQPVPLITYKTGEAEMRVVRGGATGELTAGTDMIAMPDPAAPERRIDAPIVFAGYGIEDQASGHDDLAGLDLTGKVVAVLYGVPEGAGEALAKRWSDPSAKATALMAKGATGVLIIETRQLSARAPFVMLAGYLRQGRTTLDRNADASAATPLALISRAGAEKLFAGSPIAYSAVRQAEEGQGTMPRGDLDANLKATIASDVRRFTSNNVIGKIPGGDPAVASEHLVLSAHLDHVGVGRPDASGDTIYNGAMDNAIGVTTLLSMAKRFKDSGETPRRSLLFVALTAEEKGLLGSEFMAANWPLADGEQLVGDLNFDMPVLSFPLVDVVALGEDHSTLGPAVHAAAAEVGLAVVPDPFPEENFFVRSDHYSFVKAGIPAISIDAGPGGEGEAAIRDFLANHYHKPSDEPDLINWESASKFAQLCYVFVRNVANAAERPAWNPGDEYGVRYNGYGAGTQPAAE